MSGTVGDGTGASGRLRVDKWLWAARFYRTRSIAAAAVETGHVRIGDERVKPAHPVRAGDCVSVRRNGVVFEVVVTALSDRRGSAAQAAGLYRETEAGRNAREAEIARRRAERAGATRLDGRPTKRERRRLQDFLDEP